MVCAKQQPGQQAVPYLKLNSKSVICAHTHLKDNYLTVHNECILPKLKIFSVANMLLIHLILYAQWQQTALSLTICGTEYAQSSQLLFYCFKESLLLLNLKMHHYYL
jgi:hypothetical protein